MRFSTYLNNVKCMEWGINGTQGILFSLLYDAQGWAKEKMIDDKVYYFVSRKLIVEEIPMFFDKEDTVYRNLKVLEEKGLIEFIKKEKKDFIRITEKGKTWNEFKENISEKNPTFDENSEKNPSKFGKKSEKEPKNSEKNPTNNNTIYLLNNNINNNTLVKNEFSLVCDELETKWKTVANEFELAGKQLKINDNRKKKLKLLLKIYTKEQIIKAIDKIYVSSFLRGEKGNNRWFDFDWMLKKSNFEKLIEGKYDDKEQVIITKRQNNNSSDFAITEDGLKKFYGYE